MALRNRNSLCGQEEIIVDARDNHPELEGVAEQKQEQPQEGEAPGQGADAAEGQMVVIGGGEDGGQRTESPVAPVTNPEPEQQAPIRRSSRLAKQAKAAKPRGRGSVARKPKAKPRPPAAPVRRSARLAKRQQRGVHRLQTNLSPESPKDSDSD